MSNNKGESRWVKTNRVKTVFARVIDDDFVQIVDRDYDKDDGVIEHDLNLNETGITHGEYVLVKISISNATSEASVRRIEKLEPQAYSVIMANDGNVVNKNVFEAIIASYEHFGVSVGDSEDFYREADESDTSLFVLSKHQDRYDCHLFLEKIADELERLLFVAGDDGNELIKSYFEVVKTNDVLKDSLDLTFYIEESANGINESHEDQIIGGDYWLPRDIMEFIPFAEKIVKVRNKVTIMALGESGSGKTTFGIKLAEHLGYSYSYVNAYDITDPNQWFSKETATKGTTKTKGINLYTALQKGDSVVLIDEINRVNTDLANPLMAVLDGRGEFQVDGVVHKLPDNLIIIASANIGFGYFGTFSMDMALKNRFTYTFKFGDLPDDVAIRFMMGKFGFKLSEANKLFYTFDELRTIIRDERNSINVSMSTRTLEDFAFSISTGMNIFETLKFLVFNKIDGSFPRELDEFIVKHGGSSFNESKRFTL